MWDWLADTPRQADGTSTRLAGPGVNAPRSGAVLREQTLRASAVKSTRKPPHRLGLSRPSGDVTQRAPLLGADRYSAAAYSAGESGTGFTRKGSLGRRDSGWIQQAVVQGKCRTRRINSCGTTNGPA